ncbi:ParB/RepB/Spo0J family partition protein [Acidaminobacter sp. JC074]|uniref:ParB/RepB/Spo0J family partition protein n=1 Tax=Acidaminobacter sp. JC074 TaxID=2530199 RepID=UPI001F10C85E|nr:ParB/RepB/Spo0J family partition protein [Acidaminobacter sp. JC074]MCH4891240.1 ParB/RepB/Spo0J family partition protein [Acidaminobacter sp. JC074]
MSKAKRGLGKGLGALIVQEAVEVTETSSAEGVLEYSIENIIPNVNQPRKDFSQERLNRLADSIKEYGVVQPIVLRPIPDGKYEIVAGERRYRASKLAGLETIPAIVKEFKESEFAEIALIENLQRENLNAIEEAIAYQYMIDEHQLTQDKLAKVVGKSRTYITNILRLLKLDNQVQKMVRTGQLSTAHGRTLLAVSDSKMRLSLAKKVQSEDMSVRELERLVKSMKVEKKTHIPKEKKDPIIQDFEDHLKGYFGTKVSINHEKDKGKIQINYYSEEELNRILELLDYSM